ncbi:MAG: hypothetical protein CVT99_06845 [Bacteroidetes bacterium HGW-Bacteroidetes-16]|jgi:hypothetical protein|nr:MAG: hypothetical protein CVT99_06845 [Bacteroidetes bacterium HGW-Bacteroidetes-16]
MKKLLLLVFTATLLLCLSPYAIAQNGIQVKVANNAELIQALDNPYVTSIEITQDGYYEALSMQASAGSVVVISENGDGTRGTCTVSITKNDVCWVDAVTLNTAVAGTSGDPSCPPQPTTGAYGWSATTISGGTLTFDLGVMGDIYNYNAAFTATTAGRYKIIYTWDDFTSAEIDVFFFDTPIVNITIPPTGCETISFDWLYSFGFAGPGTTVTMTISDGVNSVNVTPANPFINGETGTINFTPVAPMNLCGSYTLNVTSFNATGCSTDTDYPFYLYDTPVVNAGPDQTEVCEVAGIFNASLSGGFDAVSCDNGSAPTVLWTQLSGPGTSTFTSATTNATDVEVTVCGTYVFTFTVTNGDCVASDNVTVNFYDLPTNVNAGTDQEVCEVAGVYSTVLGGSYTDVGCGTTSILWTQVSGPVTATITNGTTLTPTVETTQCGTYEFRMEIANGLDCIVADTVAVDFFDLPTLVSAGADQQVCEVAGVYTTSVTGSFEPVLCGTTTVAWTQISGPGIITFDPVAANTNTVGVTADACGTYVLRYTVTNGPGCSAFDEMTIKFYDLPTGVSAGTAQEVCEVAGTYIADLAGTFTAVACDNGTPPTVEWTKVSGPGAVVFTDETVNNTSVTVDTCGTYQFAFWVTNGASCTVSNTVLVDFFALPVITDIVAPEKVCGYTTPIEGFYEISCGGDTTFAWTQTGGPVGGTAVFTPTDQSLTSVTVDLCGEYEFTWTVTNGLGGCSAVSSTTVTFYETPDPVISGPASAYACSTSDYIVIDGATCNDPLLITYTWSVSGGAFVGSNIGTSVTIQWDNDYTTDGIIGLVASVAGLPACTGDAIDLHVDKLQPTLEGQVKYWNAFETYMPTPFPTDLYGTFPEDYFYVTLCLNTGTALIDLETAYVQPNLLLDINGNDSTLMSYFGFDINTLAYSCDTNYVLKVWDGGLVYHPSPPLNSPTYLGASYTYTNWGGVNATDGLAIQLMATGIEINGAPYNYTWVGLNAYTPAYGYYSDDVADVNNTSTITALDALTAKYRAVGLLGSYPDNGSVNLFAPNFAVTGRMVTTLPEMTWFTPFNSPTNVDDVPFTHSGNDYLYFSGAIEHKYTSSNIPWEGKKNFINLYYEAEGDVNASYVPTSAGFKAESAIELNYEGLATTNVDNEMTISINIDQAAEIGAISLMMNYRNDLIEVLGTNYTEDDVFINQESGILNIGWFSTEAVEMEAEASVAQIRVRILGEIPVGTELFSLNANTELADATATPIGDVNLKTIGVTTDKNVNIGFELTAVNYPNPFNDATTISYTLPETGKVKVEVYNNMGMLVTTLVDETQESGVQNVTFNSENTLPGVYFYHITVMGETKNFSTVKRMIVTH